MSVIVKEKEVNVLPAGSELFEAQSEVSQVGIVLKGKVECSSKGMKSVLGTGTFIGMTDMEEGSYQASWRVVEDASVFIVPVSEKEDIKKLLRINKDYPGLMMFSMSRQLLYLWSLRSDLLSRADQAMDTLSRVYGQSREKGSRLGQSFQVGALLENGDRPERSLELDTAVLQSYLETARLSVNLQKEYYGVCLGMAYRQLLEGSTLLNWLLKDCERIAVYVRDLLNEAAGKRGCLLERIHILEDIAEATGGNRQELEALYDEAEQVAKSLAAYLQGKTGIPVTYGEAHWEQLKKRNNQGGQSEGNMVDVEAELEGSLEKLMEYGGLPEEKAAAFREAVNQFIDLKDRFSTEDSVRRLRKTLTDLFYDLYLAVFRKNLQEPNAGRLVDMFLNYGFISERLLEQNQLRQLYYRLDSGEIGAEGDIQVYTIKEWLTAIYRQEKEPSKNEFDMDFYENLRDMRKSAAMSEEEEKQYMADPFNRLEFEVRNMLRSNCRQVCGQISSFVPFLFQEQIPGDISRYCISKDAVRSTMKQLLELDYSIFYRESLYMNEEKGIQREYIQKQVYPDVILLPAAGSRGSMWQEITGKKRDSAGRFLLPSFSDSDLRDMMIPMYGRFHWELCRTIQGTSWNDIKVKSLTSEYSDYIQFYRKNKDLSEERKEKVKAQLQKARNNTREVFVMDYEIWLKFESQGAMRLNKLSREMLAMYCPFNKETRESLAKQGIYEECITRFQREMSKKQKEFELRLRRIETEKGEITQELKDTLVYYRDL